MVARELASHPVEAAVRAGQHWQTRRAAEALAAVAAPPAFAIALSREAGAPGTSVAREVGKRLGWLVYDHELLEHIAREMKLHTSLLESVDERQKSWLREVMEGFSSGPIMSQPGYARRLLEAILSLGVHGECVIVGRWAAQVLPAAKTFRVRLVAPLPDRAAAVSRRLGIPLDQATRHAQTTDRERRRFVLDHFYKDPADPELYDLILNTSRFTVEECAELIIEGLRRIQAHQ